MNLRDIARVTYSSCLHNRGIGDLQFNRLVDHAYRMDLAGVTVYVSRVINIVPHEEWKQLRINAALVFSGRKRLQDWTGKAFNQGAWGVEVLMNMKMLREGRYDDLRREMDWVENADRSVLSVRMGGRGYPGPVSRKPIIWVIDLERIDAVDLPERLAPLRDWPSKHFKIGSERKELRPTPTHVQAVRFALRKEAILYVSGGKHGVASRTYAKELLDAGANFLVTTNAPRLFTPLNPVPRKG